MVRISGKVDSLDLYPMTFDEDTMALTIPHYEMFMLARDLAKGVDLERSISE